MTPLFSPLLRSAVVGFLASVGPGLVAISQDQNIPKNPIINIPPGPGHVGRAPALRELGLT